MSKPIERDKMERLMLVMQQAMVKTEAGDLESAMLCMKEGYAIYRSMPKPDRELLDKLFRDQFEKGEP